ncbi:MAG: hypothetical protein AUJ28_03865 [Parcubacteria group bacterium CG1_02_37_51]|nr:MAG: hypothetical protein AUJ28_03865 [Parcubacteria group bacterium CG1_02_37_51]
MSISAVAVNAAPVCGNHILEAGEECDDGNTVCDDGCSSACIIEFCGDGLTQSFEECDDGNNVNSDGCNATCITEYCGDGLVNQPSEQCDDSNNIDGDGCSNICSVENATVSGIVTIYLATPHRNVSVIMVKL